MLLRLSHFRLSAYVVLVFSRQKGITLVFKTDPLQNVDVNSTFDSIAVIQSYIQKEIEGQLRNMFREDLPSIIHRLSQRWLAAQTKIPVKIDTSYPVNPIPVTKEALEALGSLRDVGLAIPSPSSLTGTNRRRRNSSLYSRASKVARSAVDLEPSAFPDIEHFDPTYGLRPEGVPTKASYNGYASLFVPDRGLSALTEDLLSSDSEDELDLGAEAASFDGGESHLLSAHPSERQEYESIPAVGGGTITRPRIYHAQSFASQQSPRPNPINSPSIGSVPIRVARTTTHDHRPQKFADEALPTPTPHTVQAEPLAGPPEPTGNLVFRPALNSNVSHLSMLSNSYHTLSPYTRSMDHYIMRSGPPKDPNATVVERQPLKARRRRTYKIRSSSVTQEEEPPQHQTMPVTPRVDPVPLSDYDRAEIEHYFRMSEN
jgi:distribution and morphology protein 34